MNAPIAPEAVQTSELAIADIAPSTTHIQELRRSRFKQEELQELAASIKNLGVVQAIVVRPTIRGVPYELVAGERRFLAAKLAGLQTIPATVRNFSDDQVLEVQLVENLQRADLHELEEAEGYDELMKLKSLSKDEVADMIGKSRAYVYARLKLLALDLDGRKAFYAGEIDASRALYVARIGNPTLRARALDMASDRKHDGSFLLSIRDLRQKLTSDEFSVDLRIAPFSLNDQSFFESIQTEKGKKGKANAQQRPLPDCISCPSRTGNCLDLFNQGDDPNVCMEPACFKVKVKQHSERIRDQAQSDGATIITGDAAKAIIPKKDKLIGHIDLDMISYHDPEEPDGGVGGDEMENLDDREVERLMESRSAAADDYRNRSYRQILEGEALPTVLVEDPKTKQIRTLVPLQHAKKALKAKGVDLDDWAYGPLPKEHPKPKAESDEAKAKRLAEEDAQAERQNEELTFRRTLLQSILDKWSGPLKREELASIVDLLIENGNDSVGWNTEIELHQFFGGKRLSPEKADEKTLIKMLVGMTVLDCLELDTAPKRLLDLSRRLKIDPDKIKKDLKAVARAKDKPAAAKPAKAAKKAKKQ